MPFVQASRAGAPVAARAVRAALARAGRADAAGHADRLASAASRSGLGTTLVARARSLAALALLTFSLSGHSASLLNGAALAILLDWLHIMAMVAWLGGLVPLSSRL